MPDIIITYAALREGGACAGGLRHAIQEARAAGIEIPRRYSTAAVPLSQIVEHLGVMAALSACVYARIDDQRLRLFAADCAERALLQERAAGREPDPRSWAAVVAAREYVNNGDGRALDAARGAAWSAAYSAAHSTARGAAVGAAYRAARSAEWGAAWSAVRSTADSAAYSAAYSAARGAACSAADSVAYSAARDWQARRVLAYLRDEPLPPVSLD